MASPIATSRNRCSSPPQPAKAQLNRVLRKLDITPREQLADALSGVSDDNREHRSASATAIS